VLEYKVKNKNNIIIYNPNKVILPGGITIQHIACTKGECTYYSKSWYMRAQVNGHRSWFKLGIDLKKATAKACEIANSLGAGGITAQLGFQQSKVKQPKTTVATLGELIDGIELSTGVFELAKATTVHEYLCSLKLVVRQVAEWKLGRKLQTAEILDLPSSCLSPALVRDFRNLRVKGIPEGPASKTARLTANGHLRNAQAVVTPGVIDHLRDGGMNIPDLMPFRSSPLFKNLRTVYVLPPDEIVMRIAKAIRDELPTLANPLFYLTTLLALHAGLRRKEIVNAKWSWFGSAGQPEIKVREGEGFTPKGDNGRKVRITRWLYDEIHKYKTVESEYILPGASRWLVNHELHGLVDWLHLKGITEEKAIHALRKLFGAFLAGYYDLTIAQRQLGHSTPLITNDFYAGIEHFNYALAKIWEAPDLLGTFEELMAQVAAANRGKVTEFAESAFGFRRFH
jgi:integrase